MPLHDFECAAGHQFEAVVPAGWQELPCEVCRLGIGMALTAQKVFLRAPAAFIPRDIHYDSPIDGRVINSKQARIEDLARHGCIEYDPCMRQDVERNKKAEEAKLDASVDATVDEFFATAPTRKREKLAQELHAGASVEVTRASPAPVT